LVEKFKNQYALHKVKLSGESASADIEAAKVYPATLANIIEDGGYLPEQVFSSDETELFSKRMPARTYIAKTEKSALGFKVAKDRVTLHFCCNASGKKMLKLGLNFINKKKKYMKNCVFFVYRNQTPYFV
jgi:hypothetical protein